MDEVRAIFRDWFDIDICAVIKDSEVAQTRLMFYRRHIYEHYGEEVDQKNLERSGDTAVRLKQVIRETQEGAHALLGSLTRMARNVHAGFHELIEIMDEPIRAFDEMKRLGISRRGP